MQNQRRLLSGGQQDSIEGYAAMALKPTPPTPILPTPGVKSPQHFRQGSPPKNVKSIGVTVLNKRNAITREGRALKARVRVRLARGEVRCFRLVRGAQRKLSIRTYGKRNLRLQVPYPASGNLRLYAFKSTKRYTVRRA